MPRPKANVKIPPWFNLAHYQTAENMDAADWYINLQLRRQLASAPTPLALECVRSPTPFIRRHDQLPFASSRFRDSLPPDCLEILSGREPRAGIESLRTEEFYFFERRLPDAVRAFGRTFEPGKTPASDAPSGFRGPLDHLFEPRLLSVFARIDLTLPDDALVDYLRDFLARERRALAGLGGVQPYRDALRSLGKCNRIKLATFAKLGVLPYMDLAQWAADTGAAVTAAQYADLLCIADDRLRETLAKVKLLLDDFILRGWLGRSAREAVRKLLR